MVVKKKERKDKEKDSGEHTSEIARLYIHTVPGNGLGAAMATESVALPKRNQMQQVGDSDHPGCAQSKAR